MAVELLQQLQPTQMDTVYIAVGGGGLISGKACCGARTAPST